MDRTILHIFPSFGMGGAQIRTIDLANNLLADMHHVIVALDGDCSAAELLNADVRHTLDRIGCRPSSRPDLGNLKAFRRLLARHRPAVLITYNWGSIEAALANRLVPLCPHLHFEDGFGQDETLGRQLPRRDWARRLALSGKSTVVVPSRTLLGIARGIWRLGSKRLRYIPNGIDCRRFAMPRRASAIPVRQSDREILIGTVGTLRAEKNVARLLRLFAGLQSEQPLRLVIVGDGPERRSLEGLAAGLGIADRTVFTGRQRTPEDVLSQLDIFAITSDTEQMPYCLIEAMAAGLPVVATDVGDVKAMMPAASQAFVATPDDEASLGTKLARLIARPTLRGSIGELNGKHARLRFDRRAMLDQYRDLFSRFLPA